MYFTSLAFSYLLVFRLGSYSCLPTHHHQKIPHTFPSPVSSQESIAGIHQWNEQLSEGCTHLHGELEFSSYPTMLTVSCLPQILAFVLAVKAAGGMLVPERSLCFLGSWHQRILSLLGAQPSAQQRDWSPGLGSEWSRDKDISSQNRIPVVLFGNVGIPVMNIWKVLFREGFSFTRVSIQRFIRPGACFGICWCFIFSGN